MLFKDHGSKFEILPTFIGAYIGVDRYIVTNKGGVLEEPSENFSPRYPIWFSNASLQVRIRKET